MKNKIVIASFMTILFGIALVNLFIPAKELSISERRKLQQFPPITLERILNAGFMKDFDKYSVDQFLFREQFRSVKAAVDRNILGKTDTNGIFSKNGHLLKIEYPLRENKVLQMATKMLAVERKLLQGMNVYYSIVPDKNCYLPQNSGALVMDYVKLERLMNQNLPEMKYINLFGSLTLDDYYTTDSHWRQEKIQKAVNTLWHNLGVDRNFNLSSYTQKSYNPFYGVYYGQSARAFKPDSLTWLENAVTRDAVVTNVGTETIESVYNLDRLGGMDGYEMFLSGMQPIITLKNPHNASNKSLLLFRDSFGSSIAPLMLEGYSTITLIDLRYAKSSILAEYVNFADYQDALFLFSTTIINNSDIID